VPLAVLVGTLKSNHETLQNEHLRLHHQGEQYLRHLIKLNNERVHFCSKGTLCHSEYKKLGKDGLVTIIKSEKKLEVELGTADEPFLFKTDRPVLFERRKSLPKGN